MADEVHATVQGNGGEQIRVGIGTKSVSITSRDIISVLLVVVMGVGFYLTVLSITDRLNRGALNQEEGFRKLEKLLDVMYTNQAAMLTALGQNREVTGNKLDAQDERLNHQTSVLNTKIDALENYIEEWFTEMGRRQELMNFNALNPEKALPLRATPPPQEHPPERGR